MEILTRPQCGRNRWMLNVRNMEQSRTAEGTERNLVAAGVVLRGHQHQARANRRRFRALRLAERTEDAEDCNIGGEDTEADGSDHSGTEDERH